MEKPVPKMSWPNSKQIQFRHLSILVCACLLAVPTSVPAAMVYGNVTGCSGEILIQGEGVNTKVSIQNGAYQVVLPSGSYQVICTDNKKSLSIRSDPSPVRKNLGF